MNEPLSRGTMLTGVIALLEAYGLDVDAIVAEVGVPLAAYGDPEARVPTAAAGRVLAAVARRGVTTFGLEVAARRTLANWGPFGEVARRQRTRGDAIEKICALISAQTEGGRFRLVRGHDTCELHCNLLYELEFGALEQAVEAAAGVLHVSLSEAAGRSWRPLAVCFRHARNAPASIYARIFRTEVLFDQEFDGFLLASEDLAAPMAGADPVAASEAERSTRPLGRGATFIEQVIEQAILLLPEGRCSADEIARALGLSVRTLQRRLFGKGLTLGAMIEEARARMARAFVDSSNRPLSEAALQLGFQSQAAFNHWYRGHFGVSPSERRRLVRLRQAGLPGGLAETG